MILTTSLAENRSTIPIPSRLTDIREGGEIRLIVKPGPVTFVFGLILNCGLILMPIILGWRDLIQANWSKIIGLSILDCMLLPTLPILTGWYRFLVRQLVILRCGTIELRTDYRLFQTAHVLELKLAKKVGQKAIYVPRIGTLHKVCIDYIPNLDGPVYFGENLSEEEAAYIAATINAYLNSNSTRSGIPAAPPPPVE